MNRKIWAGISIGILVLFLISVTMYAEDKKSEPAKAGEKDPDKSDPKAKELFLKAIEKMKGAQGYRCEYKTLMESKTEDKDFIFNVSCNITYQRPDLQYITGEAQMTGQDEFKIAMYKKGDKIVRQDNEGEWRIQPMSGGGEPQVIEVIGNLPRITQTIRLTGKEKIKEQECQVIEAVVNRENLLPFIEQYAIFPTFRENWKFTDSVLKIHLNEKESHIVRICLLLKASLTIEEEKPKVIPAKMDLEMNFSDIDKKIELFGKSRGEEMARAAGAPLLGQLPIDPELAKLCDEGNIERYHGEIVTRLGESLIEAMSSKVR